MLVRFISINFNLKHTPTYVFHVFCMSYTRSYAVTLFLYLFCLVNRSFAYLLTSLDHVRDAPLDFRGGGVGRFIRVDFFSLYGGVFFSVSFARVIFFSENFKKKKIPQGHGEKNLPTTWKCNGASLTAQYYVTRMLISDGMHYVIYTNGFQYYFYEAVVTGASVFARKCDRWHQLQLLTTGWLYFVIPKHHFQPILYTRS